LIYNVQGCCYEELFDPSTNRNFTNVFSTDSAAAATLSQLIGCQAITRHHQTALPDFLFRRTPELCSCAASFPGNRGGHPSQAELLWKNGYPSLG
jgi:hypothetical protein